MATPPVFADTRREVIATVFQSVDNRMKSGDLLRDVTNKIAAIHFTSREELHKLGALYKSMLREMRDATGDSGEFYTPRAVVRLMVTGALAPRLQAEVATLSALPDEPVAARTRRAADRPSQRAAPQAHRD